MMLAQATQAVSHIGTEPAHRLISSALLELRVLVADQGAVWLLDRSVAPLVLKVAQLHLGVLWLSLVLC